MMHPCLLIPELALCIIRFLADDRPGWNDSRYLGNTKDVAKLARTCKALAEPALDVLWVTQHSLAPLVMCLPSDVWELTGTKRGKTVVFKRDPTPHDWFSVHKYAHRIQSIPQPVSLSLPRLDDAVLTAIISPSNFGALFPYLRTLDYSVISVAAPLIQLLTDVLSTERHLESITSLCVICPKASRREEVYDLFQAIRTKATRLESLRIETFASTSSGTSFSVKLRQGEFKYLRRLELSWRLHVSRECLACIVGMVHLQDMNIGLRQDIDVDFLANGCSLPDVDPRFRVQRTFPALKTLKVTAHSLDQCTALLYLVTSPFLENITVSYDLQAPSALIEAFFRQVERTCREDNVTTSSTTSPRTISLSLKRDFGLLTSTSSPYLIHSSQTLSPLLTLRHLRALRLLHLGTLAIDDGFLREAANAWGAHIQELEECGVPWDGAEETNDLSGTVTATLDGIGAFVRGCSRLKKLRVAFDGRDVPQCEACLDEAASTQGEDTSESDRVATECEQQENDSLSSCSPLQVLNVRNSPIDNPKEVAEFLKRVAPSLRAICVEGTLDICKKWREVENWMKLRGAC